MIPAQNASGLSEKEKEKSDFLLHRAVLEKFERSKILEVYFARLDGREPESIPADYHELYEIDLKAIKSFLLGQHPQDKILQNIFKIMN